MTSPVTIVIADDESAIRNGLNQIIKNLDMNVSVVGCAENGRAALELIREFHPDIAVIDISMPEMSGLDVIKTCIEEKLSVSFLILSGYENFEYAQRAIRYGVKSYFLKPLNLAEFRDVLTSQCRKILEARGKDAMVPRNRIPGLLDSSRTLLLTQLIQNRFPKTGDIADELDVLHLSLKNIRSCVVVFLFVPGPDREDSLSDLDPLFLSGIFERYSAESWIYAENQIVSLINVENTADPLFRDAILEAIRKLSREGYRMKAGIGSIMENLSTAQLSYSSALEALSYRIYDTDCCLFDSNGINRERPSFSAENIDYGPLVHAVAQRSSEKIADYVDAFFASIFAAKMPPPNYVLGMCIYLLVNLQKQLETLYPHVSRDFEFSYDKLYQFESIKQLQQWITDILIDFSRLLAVTAVDKDNIIHTAKEYIQNNLSKNIKAKDVAKQVHLSESYFTIYFKNKTGTNFRDYLLNARMQLARRLLASKDTNIGEIAYRVGYQDYRSFSRAFKNETGMSPSEYMNSL